MQKIVNVDVLLGCPSGSPAVLFDELAGVDVRADTIPPFCTFGRGVKHVGPVQPRMVSRLEEWIDELRTLSGRDIAAIVACSVWRRGKFSDRVNRHAEGLAIDIGGVWWTRGDGVVAWNYGQQRRQALALEATMRLVFGTVLGPTADRRHADHWHVDLGKAPGITPGELDFSVRGIRRVEIVYLQESMRVLHRQQLKADGIWGPLTRAAFTRIVRSIDKAIHPDILNPDVYRAFNTATALVGFGHLEVVSR